MKKILVIDGNSIINRSFYGVRPLSTHDGRPTNAIFGMINIIQRQLDVIHPDYAAVAFDLKVPTFRHKMYPEYKAGRHATPDDLLKQFPDAKEILSDMGLHVLELPGYEADDIQGTVASMVRSLEPGSHAYILSGDRDLFQLIGDQISVLYASTETIEYNREQFGLKYPGIQPEQFVDLKALMGDSSDNIPGVAGVGEKTAIKLISTFGSLDGVYANLDSSEIAKGVRQKLQDHKESAYLSQTLARILRDIPLEKSLDDLVYTGLQREALKEKLVDLDLHSFVAKFHLNEEYQENVPSDLSVKPNFEPFHLDMISSLPNKFSLFPGEGQIYLATKEKDYLFEGELSQLKELFLAKNEIVCIDGKGLYHQLKAMGITPTCSLLDLSIYMYILDSAKGMSSVSAMALSYLSKTVSFENQNARALMDLEPVLSKAIEEIHCTDLLQNIELPLLPVLAEMEEEGFQLNSEGLAAFGEELKEQIEKISISIYERAGKKFNINSPKQLGEVLFEDLAIPYPKKKKGSYSTDAETLEEIRFENPIVEDVLLYRQLSKLHSTYVVGLLSVVSEDGRLHTDFKQTLTTTGRLSSTEPNLQNIPIRTPVGRELRRYFVPKDGYVLVDADYSQIELRLLAVMASDENMISAFHSGVDIHTATASSAFKVPLEMVTPDLRKKAKAINFGIVYGISAFALAKDLNISQAEAKRYIENYKNTYPRIDEYLNATIEAATETGYTETYYNRRRYIPELRASQFMVRALGKRLAMNAPIQGTAADIMKIAMIAVYQALSKEVPDAKLIMQVHDELVVECPKDKAEQVSALLKREMEAVTNFAVPLTAEVEVGLNWLK